MQIVIKTTLGSFQVLGGFSSGWPNLEDILPQMSRTIALTFLKQDCFRVFCYVKAS
jgi:hypothetical protein